LFISHDFGVVSRMADDIAVMYAGRVIEHGSAADVLLHAQHPYTQALLRTTPRIDTVLERLPAIPGRVPPPQNRPSGCSFRERCTRAVPICAVDRPTDTRLSDAHFAACHEVANG